MGVIITVLILLFFVIVGAIVIIQITAYRDIKKARAGELDLDSTQIVELTHYEFKVLLLTLSMNMVVILIGLVISGGIR